jgi:hypothetical protein
LAAADRFGGQEKTLGFARDLVGRMALWQDDVTAIRNCLDELHPQVSHRAARSAEERRRVPAWG